MPNVSLRGTTTFYEEQGQGPTVCIALHGGPGADHTYLPGAVAALDGVARTVLPDLRGQGRSGRPPLDTITIRNVVDDIDTLRAHLGAERIILLGHSYGGFLALEYALRYPNRLAGLVLVSTGSCMDMGHEMHVEFEKQAKLHPEAARAWAHGFDDDEGFRQTLSESLPLWFHQRVTTEHRRAFEHVVFSAAAGNRLNMDLANFDVTERLSTIHAPTLILHGRHDFMLPAAQGERLHHGIPGSKLVMFEKSGHFMWLEETAAYGSALRTWASGVPRARAEAPANAVRQAG